jgi:hypothetical protein
MSARELTEMILGHDTPLRLDEAAKIAFPRGGMTAAGLRREAKRGRLVIERVAGKDFTTLGHIARMREQCRVRSSRQDSIHDQNSATKTVESSKLPPGLSLMEVANSELGAALATSKGRNKR